MSRLVVVAIADMHAGHQLGLCNPATVLVRADDEGQVTEWRPELREIQGYLWNLYSKDSVEAVEWAAGDPIVLIHDGDATHGQKHPAGLMDITSAEQEQVAAWNLKPWLTRAKAVRMIHGTEAHGLLAGSTPAETHIAAELARQGMDARAVYHERCTIGGTLFDIAHHGPNESIRLHLGGDNARRYLKDRMARDDAMGKAPARVYLRGHFHIFIQETVRQQLGGVWCESTLIVLPSLCGASAFSRKVTQSLPLLCNGMVLFEIVDGRLREIRPLVEWTDLRTEEVIA